ncbi:DUF4129 domain-containing protein [Halosolutus halophilus]|uniref:DUF4129 domain-containing protein n=1 Tax=Halosolutus halophilus TaxID=1552990 RepID=UPI0022351E5B|nr:DUF4129 domain-containing protein [Halosolutus halophilus]
MDRRTGIGAVVAAVGVLAVALAAATLPSTVDPESGVGGDGGEGGAGEGTGPGFGTPPPDERPIDAFEVPLVEELVAVLLLLAALVLLVYAVRNWRGLVPVAVGIAALVGLLVVLFTFLGDLSAVPGGPASEPMGNGGYGGGGGDGTTGFGDTTSLPFAALFVLTVAVLGMIFVIARSSTPGAGSIDPADDTGSDDTDRAAIGRAAGRAADRIERGDDVDNDVVRAWQEMTSLLDVSRPETTTPREFATVAADAGMDPDDVRELTRLFEDVRYGEYSPTDDRERRAVRVFRRIERAYGADDE